MAPTSKLSSYLAPLPLVGMVAVSLVMVAGGASYPDSSIVASSRPLYPLWMSGPLTGMGPKFAPAGFATLLALLGGFYLVTLLLLRHLSLTILTSAIVLLHLIFLLSPPLFSTDVFNYLSYARAGALYGFNPYQYGPAVIPLDPSVLFSGHIWRYTPSAYGPLFTLFSYALAPLSLAQSFWVLKGLTCLASLLSVYFVYKIAEFLKLDAKLPLAFMGLSPILLAWGVGGVHNEFFMILPLLAGLYLSLRGMAFWGSLIATLSLGVKLTVAPVLVFMLALFLARGYPLQSLAPLELFKVLKRRARARGFDFKPLEFFKLRLLLGFGMGVLLVSLAGYLKFGSHLINMFEVVKENQDMVSAASSIPLYLLNLLGAYQWGLELKLLFGLCTLAFTAWAFYKLFHGWGLLGAAGWSLWAVLLTTQWILPWYLIALLPIAALSGNRKLRLATLGMTAMLMLMQMHGSPQKWEVEPKADKGPSYLCDGRVRHLGERPVSYETKKLVWGCTQPVPAKNPEKLSPSGEFKKSPS